MTPLPAPRELTRASIEDRNERSDNIGRFNALVVLEMSHNGEKRMFRLT